LTTSFEEKPLTQRHEILSQSTRVIVTTQVKISWSYLAPFW